MLHGLSAHPAVVARTRGEAPADAVAGPGEPEVSAVEERPQAGPARRRDEPAQADFGISRVQGIHADQCAAVRPYRVDAPHQIGERPAVGSWIESFSRN